MATYTADAAQTGVQPRGTRVGLVGVKASVSLPSVSTSIGTILNMVKVPANASVMYMTFWMNVSGEFTLQVGDSVNGSRYYSVVTHSSGLGTITPTIAQIAYKYSADDTIVMRVSLVSVQTLGGAAHMNVIFSMDANASS
jgi:hypothetical protein